MARPWNWSEYYRIAAHRPAEDDDDVQADKNCASLIVSLTEAEREEAQAYARDILQRRKEEPNRFLLAANRRKGRVYALDSAELLEVAKEWHLAAVECVFPLKELTVAQEAEVSRIIQFRDLSAALTEL